MELWSQAGNVSHNLDLAAEFGYRYIPRSLYCKRVWNIVFLRVLLGKAAFGDDEGYVMTTIKRGIVNVCYTGRNDQTG